MNYFNFLTLNNFTVNGKLPNSVTPCYSEDPIWKTISRAKTVSHSEEDNHIEINEQWSQQEVSMCFSMLCASSAVYFNICMSSALCLTAPFVHFSYFFWVNSTYNNSSILEQLINLPLLRDDLSSHLSLHLSCDMTSSPHLQR